MEFVHSECLLKAERASGCNIKRCPICKQKYKGVEKHYYGKKGKQEEEEHLGDKLSKFVLIFLTIAYTILVAFCIFYTSQVFKIIRRR